jgi:hypothetical protein
MYLSVNGSDYFVMNIVLNTTLTNDEHVNSFAAIRIQSATEQTVQKLTATGFSKPPLPLDFLQTFLQCLLAFVIMLNMFETFYGFHCQIISAVYKIVYTIVDKIVDKILHIALACDGVEQLIALVCSALRNLYILANVAVAIFLNVFLQTFPSMVSACLLAMILRKLQIVVHKFLYELLLFLVNGNDRLQ